MSLIGENIHDRLSMLPEEIITHILSLMPTEYAVRTSVLSKSWRYSWMLLKNLKLVVCQRPFVNKLQLICGCPVLESLYLSVTIWKKEEDYILNIPTLKRLKLRLHRTLKSLSNKLILNLPNLEYLSVHGFLGPTFVMEDVSSLVEASVSLEASYSLDDVKSNHQCIEFLKGISGVQSLSIHEFPLFYSVRTRDTLTLPIFRNMKHLKLTRFLHNAIVLKFLESCPELKHLCIRKVVGRWFEPKWVPACMLTNLTTIKISRCLGTGSEMDFIKYMLGNAEVLKTVTITLEVNSREDKKRLCALLLELPRTSRCCEVCITVRKRY